MAFHTEDPLRCPCIAKIFNLLFTISTPEAAGAKRMVACEDSQILNLVPTCTAAVCTIVADEGAIAEEEEIRIGVEEGPASIATKAINVPSIASYTTVSVYHHQYQCVDVRSPSSKAFPSSRIWIKSTNVSSGRKSECERGRKV